MEVEGPGVDDGRHVPGPYRASEFLAGIESQRSGAVLDPKLDHANREMWDRLAREHPGTEYYGVARLLAGGDTLRPGELEELGEVDGRDLLHLMCHIGTETLSLARHGARVTGVDYSGVAVETAWELAGKTGLPAEFLQSDVFKLDTALPGRSFDIAYTAIGVLGWVPDLSKWAKVVNDSLRPGGRFYILEFHPITAALRQDDLPPGVEPSPEPRIAGQYFSRPEPRMGRLQGSYTGGGAASGEELSYAWWPHGLGETATALAREGLHIDSIREYDYSVEAAPYLERAADGMYRLKSTIKGEVPLMFSIRATKPR